MISAKKVADHQTAQRLRFIVSINVLMTLRTTHWLLGADIFAFLQTFHIYMGVQEVELKEHIESELTDLSTRVIKRWAKLAHQLMIRASVRADRVRRRKLDDGVGSAGDGEPAAFASATVKRHRLRLTGNRVDAKQDGSNSNTSNSNGARWMDL